MPQTPDHDLLITVNTKLDVLSGDVKILGDGLVQRMSNLESRVNIIDTLHAQVDPVGSRKLVLDLKEEMHDWKTTVGIYRAFAGLVGAFGFFVLTQIPNILRFFGIMK